MRLLVLVLLAAAALAALGARAALADTPTVQLSFDNSSIPAGGSVTMTATVTSTVGIPTGSVSFFNAASPDTALASHALDTNVTSNSATAQVLVSGLPSSPFPYSIYAVYTPDLTAALGLGLSKAQSVTLTLTVGGTAPTTYDTQVTLTTPSLVVDSTAPVTLTATVAEIGGSGTPTGTVSFTDTSSGSTLPLGSGAVTLASGVAQLTVLDFSPGPHQIVASYNGGGNDNPSPSQPLLLTSNPPAPTQVDTTTALNTPSLVVDSTAPVTLTATVAEIGGTGTPTGTVSFTDTSSGPTLPLGPGAVTLASGVAQLTVFNFSPGPHQIVASYNGGGNDNPSSSQPLLLTSNPPVDTRVQTTTAVTVSPSTIAAGDTATITATIAQIGATSLTAPPGGTVTFDSYSIWGQGVYLGTAALGTAPAGMTAAPNQAIIEVAAWQAADYIITASYFGDIFDRSSGGELPFSVLPGRAQTTIAYSGDTTAEFEHSATFAATVTDHGGSPLAGRAVTFTLGSQSCTGTSDANGYASCSFVVTEDPGSPAASVSVLEDLQTQAATLNLDFTVTPQPTAITAGFQAGPVTTALTATLLTDTGAPVANAAVTLTLGAETCSATTNGAGLATCDVSTIVGQPTATLSASYGGDTDHEQSATSGVVQLVLATSLSYTGAATTGEYNDRVTLSGTLFDSTGTALSGQTLAFTLGSQSCSATTRKSGKASCKITLNQPSGGYAVSVNYAGDSTFASSTASRPFTIAREETTLFSHIANVLLNNDTISLSATLLEDGVAPIANRTVTMTLGHASCTAVTNTHGVATCVVQRAATLGPSTFTATFAGDAYYLPASLNQSTLLCAFPSGGSFVIGDRDSGSVTFWGAQWWKQNSLSHGDAPSSFKGWAQGSFDQSANGGWSTDPGNSASPPSGQLPAYMAVIETSSTTKLGSRIFGDGVHIVVVKTGPGYSPSPGHAGTGTIVARIS